jgi:hypothetical protein
MNNALYVDGAKYATIAAAIAALPSCTVPSFSQTWNHCGTIILPPGKMAISSQVSITSPFVRIQGSGPEATYLNYTGTTGCMFSWTSSPFNSGGEEGDELSDLTIDGSGASAGTCGLHFYDITAFSAHNVDFRFFNGSGSSGLWEDAITEFDERAKIQAQFYENTFNWLITNNVSSASSSVTFGYGTYDLSMNCDGSSQTCVLQQNGAGAGAGSYPYLTYSNLRLTINSSGLATGISIQNGTWSTNLYNIHMEGVSTGFNLANGVIVDGIGPLQENPGITDLIGSNAFFMGVSTRLDTVNGVNNIIAGNRAACATGSPSSSFTVCGRYGGRPFQVDYNGSKIFQLDTNGAAIGGFSAEGNLTSSGNVCTNAELALSGGWGSTASVGSVAGTGQTCQWTITSNGTGTGANPTITDTLTNTLPSATTVCDMRMVGGTGASTLINQKTLSATAPVFAFGGKPAGGATYIVVRRCGP